MFPLHFTAAEYALGSFGFNDAISVGVLLGTMMSSKFGKRNTFLDYIHAAKYLIENKYEVSLCHDVMSVIF